MGVGRGVSWGGSLAVRGGPICRAACVAHGFRSWSESRR